MIARLRRLDPWETAGALLLAAYMAWVLVGCSSEPEAPGRVAEAEVTCGSWAEDDCSRLAAEALSRNCTTGVIAVRLTTRERQGSLDVDRDPPPPDITTDEIPCTRSRP